MIIRLTDTEIDEEDLYTMIQSLVEGLCNQAGAPFSEVYTAEERAQGLRLWAYWAQIEAGDSLRDVMRRAEDLIGIDIKAWKEGIEAPF